MSWEQSQRIARAKEKAEHPEKYCLGKKCLRNREPGQSYCPRCLKKVRDG